MTTKELELWEGEFGDQYTERNMFGDKEIAQRVMMWTIIGASIIVSPKTILEVGAGAGINLVAIARMCEANNTKIDLHAIEPNTKARTVLKEQHIPLLKWARDGTIFEIPLSDSSMDMVFTSGVLIHINPEDTLKAMKEIYRVARRTIVCIEYFSPELREIKYRGQDKALWTNDFGSLWLDNFKLACTGHSFFWKRLTGLDNLTFWTFEKVN